MSYHMTINKPRKGTFGQYSICEIRRDDKGLVTESKFIRYAKDNIEAKRIVDKYCEFHFIESIVYSNGREKKI